MHKKWVIIVTLVLGVSLPGWAAVDQVQLMDLGSANSLFLSGNGLVLGSSANAVDGSAQQEAVGSNGRSLALQVEYGVLYQVIAGGGADSSFGVDQLGSGIGAQAQSQPDGAQLGDQNQAYNVGLNTQAAALGGQALLHTMQGFVGAQYQIMLNPYGGAINITKVGATDSGMIRQ